MALKLGDPSWTWESPGCWIYGIQLCYDTRYSSVFEYAQSFGREGDDWRAVVGEECPLCGRKQCWREISPYWRKAIELFPFREEMIPIARFQCRERRQTFSLLPYQLAPYHQYTIESMILAVVLWAEIHTAERNKASAAVEELPGDCQVTPWLLRHWVGVVLVGFRGGHGVLCRWYDLSGLHSGERLMERLDEIYDYYRSLGSRGPPSRLGLREMVRRYSRVTGRYFLGVPSQERGRLSAR
jgi:hypothetical protein